MNSLTQAAALVPAPVQEESAQPLMDSMEYMDLEDLIAALILPKEAESWQFDLAGIVQHFRKKPKVPTEEITAGAIESLREMQELNEAGAKHEDTGFSIIKRIAKWGFKKIVKWVFKEAFKLIYKIAKWVFKKIIVNGIKALVEWLVEPMLEAILGFLGINVELWPFLAIGGGVAALGYTGWKMFFDKPEDSTAAKVGQKGKALLGPEELAEKEIDEAVDSSFEKALPEESAESLAATREAADAALTTPGLYEEAPTAAAKGQAMVQRAAAPRAAGAPSVAGAADSSLGGLISRGEGTYTSVNYGAAHGYKAGTVDLPNMTVAEVMSHQQAQDFNAVGRYQIIKPTLAAAVKAIGLTGNEKFDKALQDRIFEQYLLGIKRRAIGDYISGKSDNIQQAILEASQEWASVAAPAGAKTQGGSVSDGTISYYSGVANNKASINATEMARALDNARTAHSALGPSTQVASAQQVQQTPAVNMSRPGAQTASPQGTTTVASTSTARPNAGKGSDPPSSQVASNAPTKDYIQGPKGSLIAVG